MACYRPKFTFALPFLSGLMCSDSQIPLVSAVTPVVKWQKSQYAVALHSKNLWMLNSIFLTEHGLCQPSSFQGNTTFQKPALISLEREIFSHCTPYFSKLVKIHT
jgi:hypothetical protein